jgi:serine/threonine protein kinase
MTGWQLRFAQIMRDAAIGMVVLHHAGITHKDFKPQNLLVDGLDMSRPSLTKVGCSCRSCTPGLCC